MIHRSLILSRMKRINSVAIAAAVAFTVPLFAQPQRPGVSPADYARAERLLAPALNSLVVGGSVAPNWIANDRFWYRTAGVDGSVQTILDPPIDRVLEIVEGAE